jgi:hypothetical protein
MVKLKSSLGIMKYDPRYEDRGNIDRIFVTVSSIVFKQKCICAD